MRASETDAFASLASSEHSAVVESVLSLRLKRAAAATNNLPSLAGTYQASARWLEFIPSFPLLAGETYVAEFNAAALPDGDGRDRLRLEFTVPKAAVPAPRLTAIYPSGDKLPANHLKFYLVFSGPMQQGEAFKHLKLIRDDGVEVPDPWRDVELWSPDGKRFTLWLHPGRQKTGVNLNIEIGPCLVEGHRYTLVVSGDWKSQAGEPLGRSIEKKFLAGLPRHAQLDMAAWQLRLPKPGSRDPLRVTFPAPLDWALLHSELWIERANGERVAGRISTAPGEREWTFEPEQPWQRGAYRLVAATVLEDLAGNSLARKFESEAGPAPPKAGPATAAKPFDL
ncbi:MAG: hypothetical protein HY300_00165 [Verrucomicrobia bacterium]|nr:hypothetical protein [Verrucomicrobiota bacterium]